MIRNLKALGLALVAVFAISAMAASAAQAESAAGFWAESGAVKIDTLADSSVQEYVNGLGTLTCTTPTGYAEVEEEESTELTAHEVGFDKCEVDGPFGIKFPATVITGSDCHFTFTAGTYTAASDDSHGSVHICAQTINVYSDAAHENLYCQSHVAAQTVSGVTFTNTTTEGVMAVTIDANGLKVAETVTDFNNLGCNNHVSDNATYTGTVWAKATNEAKEYVDTTVTG